MSTLVETHVRWMIRRDMPSVLDIEYDAFDHPWDEETFIVHLRQRNIIGMTAERDGEIVGYMLYELHKHKLHVLNFAVKDGCRRTGVGTAMVDKLKGKLSAGYKARISLQCRETNLPAQLFFREQGFRAISVLKDAYVDTDEDAYLFAYRLK